MRTLKVGKKNYKLEYSFEAVCNEECVEKTIDLITMITSKDGDSAKKIAKLPGIVIDLVMAGLIANNPVETKEDAKEFVKQYFKENQKENFVTLATTIAQCMGEDGFLKLIGLEDENPTDQNVEQFPMNPPEE